MSGVELPSHVEQSTRRSGGGGYHWNAILGRILHGAGGDGTNYLFAVSLGIIVCAVVIIVNSTVGVPSEIAQEISDREFIGGNVNLKAPEGHRQVQLRPQNLSIVILGDTLSRYSYLSLVYYLRWGRWFDPGLSRSNLVDDASFDSPFHPETYNEFYFQSNIMLQPYEMCDCHKYIDQASNREFVYENRYYHDPIYNNTVTYIHAWSDGMASQGRLEAENIYTEEWKWSTKEKGLMGPGWQEPVWKYGVWSDIVENHVAKIKPKPTYAILQAGELEKSTFGPRLDFGAPETAPSVQEANHIKKSLKNAGIRAFWSTTTFNSNHATDEMAGKRDRFMCSLLGACLDNSWTKEVKSDLYLNSRNFHEPVYRSMNEDLLEVLGQLPKDYIKIDRALLL